MYFFGLSTSWSIVQELTAKRFDIHGISTIIRFFVLVIFLHKSAFVIHFYLRKCLNKNIKQIGIFQVGYFRGKTFIRQADNVPLFPHFYNSDNTLSHSPYHAVCQTVAHSQQICDIYW